MSTIYYLNQPPNPIHDFLRQLGGQHGFPQPNQQPPAYGQGEGVGQDTARAREQNQEQPAPSQAGQRPVSPEQQEQQSGNGCPGGHGWRGRGRGRGCGGRGGRSHHHRGGGPWQHPRRQGAWGSPWTGMYHPFFHGAADQSQSNEQHGQQERADPFNLGSFLQNLGSHFGNNLQDILSGVDPAAGTQSDNEVDFTPRADIFDTQSQYVVHVSLPGAQKQDISVDYDTGNSTLQLAGFVHRPDIDEALSSSLVVSGRDREVGVFERQLHLGTRSEPASVDVERINARMSDGVLIVVLPKLTQQEEPSRKKVPVTHTEKEKENESGKEKELGRGEVETESETEAGDGAQTVPSPTARDEEEEEEMDYITVDVD